MRILMLGKDPDYFVKTGRPVAGDTLTRHVFYCQELRKRFPSSELSILTYSKAENGREDLHPTPGMVVRGTRSFHRVFYVFGLIKRFPEIFSNRWRPDIVTVQTPWEEGVIGWLVSKIFRASFVVQLHFDLFSPEWLEEHPLNGWRRRVALFILKRSDRIRVVSESLAQRVAQHTGIDRRKIGVAPVGVNFQPQPLRGPAAKSLVWPDFQDHPILLFVGRLCHQKNLVLWLRVAQILHERFPAARYVLVGDGEERVPLERLARQFNLGDKIRFMGAQDHRTLPGLYAAADVFLLTSHYEGFGRVVLEAQLAGLPVVTTVCCGPEDIVLEGQTGFVLKEASEERLAEAVLKLFSNPALASEMGQKAAALSQERFSLSNLTRQLIDVWKDALHESSATDQL